MGMGSEDDMCNDNLLQETGVRDMENETGTQERAGGDGSQEGGVKYAVRPVLGSWWVRDESDGRMLAMCTRESDCRMIVDALNNSITGGR